MLILIIFLMIRETFLSPLNDRICYYYFYRKQRGRLKICSKSILFDPIDTSYPILKVHGCFVVITLSVCHRESDTWKTSLFTDCKLQKQRPSVLF